jgi:UDP-N-acetylglucosamine/UDP-N-acetylgalactosamine diphosphorylase
MTISSYLPIDESDFYALKERFEASGQGHIFQFFDSLEPEQQCEFVRQLVDIDVSKVNTIYQKAVEGAENAVLNTDATFEPLPQDVFGSVLKSSPEQLREWETLGLSQIAQGRVAVILMAGGQGTRLGSSAPKGCYDINLPSHKSLFQLQAERILRLQNIARQYQMPGQLQDCTIPWYIMTSGPTHGPTYEFFEKNKFFGLKKENIIFFEQGKVSFLLFSTDFFFFKKKGAEKKIMHR